MLNAVPSDDFFNAYMTLEEAEHMMASRLDTEAWDALNNDRKERYIMNASELLNKYTYKGNKFYTNNHMEWPRSGIPYPKYQGAWEKNPNIMTNTLFNQMNHFNMDMFGLLFNPLSIYYEPNMDKLEAYRSSLVKYFYDPWVVPLEVKKAVTELIIYILTTDVRGPFDNVKKAKLGDMETEFFEQKRGEERDTFPNSVRWLLKYFIIDDIPVITCRVRR